MVAAKQITSVPITVTDANTEKVRYLSEVAFVYALLWFDVEKGFTVWKNMAQSGTPADCVDWWKVSQVHFVLPIDSSNLM